MLLRALTLLAALTGPPTEARVAWLEIGYAGGGLGVAGKAAISLERVTGMKDYKLDPNTPPRWEAELRSESTDLGGAVKEVHQRADGRTCPGVAQSLSLLASIPPLRPQDPGSITEQWPPLAPADGAAFFFHRYGRIAGSNALYSEGFGDAPGLYLAPVWQKVSAALKPCWTDVADPIGCFEGVHRPAPPSHVDVRCLR